MCIKWPYSIIKLIPSSCQPPRTLCAALRSTSATFHIFSFKKIWISFHSQKPKIVWRANNHNTLCMYHFHSRIVFVFATLPHDVNNQLKDGIRKDGRKSSNCHSHSSRSRSISGTAVRRTNSYIFASNVISTSVSFMVRAGDSWASLVERFEGNFFTKFSVHLNLTKRRLFEQEEEEEK